MGIDVVLVLEILGTIAFAISGATVAIEEKMDVFGVCILGITTAVGGGMIRDIVLGVTPPLAFRNPVYATTALVVSLIVFLPAARQKISLNTWLYWIIDSIGLAVFTMVGALMGAPGKNLFLVAFLATVTGVGGGVLRDIFADKKPVIFQKNFYATISLLGAIVFVLLLDFNRYIAAVAGGIVIFVLRILAIRLRWNLPKA